MTPRERVATLFRHEIPDRMPITLDVGGGDGITGPYLRVFREKTGHEDPAEYFGFDIRTVTTPLVAHSDDFTIYHPEIPPDAEFDEFGVIRVPSETFPLGHVLSPWQRFTSTEEMLDYPFPTFELHSEVVAKIIDYHARDYPVSVPGGSINEWCYYIRSMEAFMMDLAVRPEMAEILLDKVTSLSAEIGAAMAKAGADIVSFYGDVGSQCSMMMSPKMWREWIKPRWKKIFDAVRDANPETLIFFHSCGFIEPIIEDFIELGLDILNPIQPEAMDPYKLKQEYGDKLSLWGGIGLQSTMQVDDPEEVRRSVRDLIDAWAPGGGALVTTVNTLPLDIPWENIVTLIETVREYSPEAYRNLG